MQDVPYWREKAGIAELFCGSKIENTTAKTNAGKIFNTILTSNLPLHTRSGHRIRFASNGTKHSTLVAGVSLSANTHVLYKVDVAITISPGL